jgi:hypothetical protein
VLEDLSLSVGKGELVSLLGASGLRQDNDAAPHRRLPRADLRFDPAR